MTQAIFVVSTHLGSGLTSSAMGLFRACEHLGLRVSYFKPIGQSIDSYGFDAATKFLQDCSVSSIEPPISFSEVESYLSKHQVDSLLERIVQKYQSYAEKSDIVIVEGLNPDKSATYVARLNPLIAQTLSAHVLMVTSPLGFSLDEFLARIEIHSQLYRSTHHEAFVGVMFNKMNSPEQQFNTSITPDKLLSLSPIFSNSNCQIAGFIPWNKSFTAPRTKDIQTYLKAKIIEPGQMESLRVEHVVFAAEAPEHLVPLLKAHTLVIIPCQRDDAVIATAMAAMTGIPIAGIVLTSDCKVSVSIRNLIGNAVKSGLPVLSVAYDSQEVLRRLYERDDESDSDDWQRLELVSESVSQNIDHQILQKLVGPVDHKRLSPPAFRYELMRKASMSPKTIVLPEGEEERTVKAAVICQEKKIANCILLGSEEKIKALIDQNQLSRPSGLQVLDPNEIKDQFVEPMVNLRAHKNLVAPVAQQQLEDPIVVGTMMVATGRVDGLVAGALNTTANTIRPALQLIGASEDKSLMSSIFFMCLPDQVVVYGDCAVNPSPSAQDLAYIAIQSAESARQFGIEPKVAMISYSTGDSGKGADVSKVTEATRLAKELDPNLIIDGPLQYDAAVNPDVARKKAPQSPVAGQATVFIFPDLNTGNTTYKAVQRSAKVISIGPMLQGLKKPVNDLSRGALVDDIVFTIALTAIQAQK